MLRSLGAVRCSTLSAQTPPGTSDLGVRASLGKLVLETHHLERGSRTLRRASARARKNHVILGARRWASSRRHEQRRSAVHATPAFPGRQLRTFQSSVWRLTAQRNQTRAARRVCRRPRREAPQLVSRVMRRRSCSRYPRTNSHNANRRGELDRFQRGSDVQ